MTTSNPHAAGGDPLIDGHEPDTGTALRLAGLRRDAITRLTAVSSTPALDADLLITAALGRDRAFVLAHGEYDPTIDERSQIEAWMTRAAAGEPIAYILGWRGFYDGVLAVSPAVLIPRPETELLLERALAWGRRRLAARGSLIAADIGTGSGALAVMLARHLPAASVYAVDVSAEALTVAQANARAVAPQVIFHHGDLLDPLITAGIMVDLIMANLPYIPAAVVPTLAVSTYEPVIALDGGADGLAIIRRLLAAAPQVLTAGGLILLEIGADQGTAALREAGSAFPGGRVTVYQDYAGLDRIVEIAPP